MIDKKPICVELPTGLVLDAKQKAKELDVPFRKVVELALRDFLSSDPQITMSFNANTSK